MSGHTHHDSHSTAGDGAAAPPDPHAGTGPVQPSHTHGHEVMPGVGRADHEGHRDHCQDHGHGDHGDHAGHGDHVGRFRRLFWIMLVLAVPVVGFSMTFAMIIGYSLPDAAWVGWVSPVLGTVMYLWGGSPFLTGAVGEAARPQAGDDAADRARDHRGFPRLLGCEPRPLDHQLDFWWELALLIVIMLLGHWIEMRSLAQTTSALDSLAALLPDEAERVRATTVTVAPSELPSATSSSSDPAAACPRTDGS